MGVLFTIIFIAMAITVFTAILGWAGFRGITWILHQVIQRMRWMVKDDTKKGGE